MKNVLTALLAIFPTTQALAASINGGYFDAERQTIELDVTYGGGCKQHQFTLEIGQCQETYPVSCPSVRLVDLTNDDLCEALITRKISLPLAKHGLDDKYYSGASLVIKGDDDKQVSIVLKKADIKAAKNLTCSMSNTKARPYYSFLVNFDGSGQASIDYVKSAFFGSEELVVARPIAGCESAQISTLNAAKNSLYIECDGDGDAGYLSVKRTNKNTWLGSMSFPNSGPEGLDSVSLKVSCRE